MRDCKQNHLINVIMPFSREVLVHKNHALHVMLTFHQGTMRCSEPAKSTKVTQPSMSPVAMKMRHSLDGCCGIWLHDVIGRCCDGKTFQNLFAFLSQAFLEKYQWRLWVLDTDLLATLRISNWLHARENGQFNASSLASHAWEREDWSWTPVAAVALNLPPVQTWKLQKSLSSRRAVSSVCEQNLFLIVSIENSLGREVWNRYALPFKNTMQKRGDTWP